MSESNVNVQVDLHDSEIIKIEGVLRKLNEKMATSVNLEQYRKEIIDRFADIGFGVAVRVYTTNEDGVYAFDIDIEKRLTGEFDPDRQVHEVTNDLLNLGEGGVIKTGGLHVVGGHDHGGHHHHN